LFVLAWVILLGQPASLSVAVRGPFVRLTTPFARLADLVPVIHSRNSLAKQNQQLRAENTNLRRQVEELQHAQSENQQFRALLQIKQAAPWRTVGARVIGRDASNWWKSIQIDRGRADGIRVNQPVLSASGLIGKTVSVSEGESRVLLLIDPTCKASAVLQPSREPGTISGTGGAAPRLLLTFVSREAVIATNETVYTSGLGGVFPRGILIGTVANAELDRQSGMYQNLEVQPAADFRRLEEVMVIVE
jgi:rod shape-determining protein MreC